MRKVLSFLCIMFFPLWGFAQLTQAIKGTVRDKESRSPLVGVVVTVISTGGGLGNVTDESGRFVIANVPVGKHSLRLSYLGYQVVELNDILVTSGREVVLTVEMEETATKIEEVTVSAKRGHINEMAIVSARTFDVQEAERYAGSRADPARMASNFAGVQGADDSRNDIVIRGNSPQGVLWRLEGVDIPNPNHFSVPGTTGGPVSMLNSKTLGNSDFFMGAFPAEYGNATGGVFDLKLRNGNADRTEVTAQLGFLGTELAAEGPISQKNGSSFLVAYRYSTLKLFEGLNIKIGTSSVPNYQDATFKLNFPMGQKKKANLSFFGIGGLSKIDLIVSNLTEQPEELYGESDRDQYFYSNTGVVGSSFGYIINSSTYTNLTVAYTANRIGSHHDKVFRGADFQVDSLKSILDYTYTTRSTVAHWYINKKLSVRHTIKAGLVNTYYDLDLLDSSRQYPPTRQQWEHRSNFSGGTNLAQGYVQYKYRPNDKLTATAGVHGQYLSHNGATAIEPRAALRYRVNNSNSLSLGYGLHSQMQQLYQYFAHLPQNSAAQMHNYDIGFTRSHHLVLGYDHRFSNVLRVSSEVYYQYLFNIPVEKRAGSSFSGLNQGNSFSRIFPDTLQNTGTGYNYGMEVTIEKQFSKGYYFLLTGAVFNSEAKGNDGVYRSTDYNTRFATNLLVGYEHRLGKNSTLFGGLKVTYAGGQRYSPPDIAASNTIGDYVVVDSLRNTLRFPNYFRTDVKAGVRFNRKKVTHEIAVDLVNVTGQKNLLNLTYSSDLAMQGSTYPFLEQYQLGFLPLFYYRLDFGSGKK
ncbi:MAG: TonB-dependent receptor [Flavipsychrobacter sp.]|nr:TonB-dependent receptor [Flavipsychrobacter sp.]